MRADRQHKINKKNMKICKKLSKNPKVLPETCRLNIMCSLNKKGERMMKNKKQFLNENNKVQKLAQTAALSLALSLLISPVVMAEVPVPTLDKLHQAGTTIPDTDPAQVYPESGYILTNTPSDGNFTITNYEWSDSENKYIPVYYKLELKDNYKNIGSGTQSAIFGWESAANNSYNFVENPTDYTGPVININYDSDNTYYNEHSSGKGGALTNYSFKEELNYNFINNSLSGSSEIRGGALYNSGEINNINGVYIGNSISGSTESLGGAINNDDTIHNINAVFIGNHIGHNSGARGWGGAICNNDYIGNINGVFIGNYVYSARKQTVGGAISSRDSTKIDSINADFLYNYAQGGVDDIRGGAIHAQQRSTIGSINGDFIGNYILAPNSTAYGGAIIVETKTHIGAITGNFIENYAKSRNYSKGGAIKVESGTIDDLNVNFTGNQAISSNSYGYGGAVYNEKGNIGKITGDFISNSATGTRAYGGAIYNYGSSAEIGPITGDFILNSANGKQNRSSNINTNGGAIFNDYNATIDDITGDFIGNYATGSRVYGGAIDSSNASIGDITGDFIGNYATAINSDSASGGAISVSEGSIGHIKGNFTGNYVSVSNSTNSANGGAIFNYMGTIAGITGDFIGNYSYSVDSKPAYSGAIYNNGTINDVINGNFTSNYVSASGSGAYVYGGAIYNRRTIENITGNFTKNYVVSDNSYAHGGAIYNEGRLTLTNSNFSDNYAKAQSNTAHGGAIYVSGGTTNIIADNGQSVFSGNYVEDINGKRNEAIYAGSSSSNINLTAQNNGSIRFDDMINGVSGYNLNLSGDGTGTISLYNDVKNAKVTAENVTIDFTNGETRNYDIKSIQTNENTYLNLDINISDSTNPTADKITTQNSSSGIITVNMINFIGQYEGTPVTVQILDTQSDALQLALSDNIITIPDVDDTVYNDQIISEAGAIELATINTTNDGITIKDKIYDTLDVITTKESANERNFTFRTADNYNLSKDLGTVTEGTLNINGKGVDTPSTINAQNHTMFNLQNETTLNIKNTTIDGAKDFAIKAEHENAVVNLTNVSVKGTTSDTPDVNKAAIQSKVDLNITADAGKSEFSGNTAAIQMDDASKTITMNSVNEGEIVLEDVVDGQAGYSVELKGDDKSKITVNNNINNAKISLTDTNLYVAREDLFNQSQALSLNSGTMYLNNNVIGTMHVPTLNLNGNTDLYVDVDLANESMDRVTADTYNVADDAVLNVADLNLISTTEKENVKILFADEPLANNVAYSGDSTISYKGTNVIYSPIYKYTVNYGVDENDKQGYFFFNKATAGIGDGSGSDIGGGAAGNVSDSFNPSVLAPNVIQQAGAYTTQLQTFNYAFQHADTFMNIPYLERISMINANKYAMSPTADATDVGTFSPLLTKEEDAGFWVKPYASFENVPLKNGPKVSNINYGTLVGYDSPLQEISHGFERVLTGYIGYNGASQRYSGVDAYQNGGLIGGTATFYKGNFFNATTLSVGASAGDASTMYGSENYTMLLAGIGNKTGYNFEFFDGGLILQPNMLISYTFVNTFDYNNAAGVRIESDPLHAIQLQKRLAAIHRCKYGMEPA